MGQLFTPALLSKRLAAGRATTWGATWSLDRTAPAKDRFIEATEMLGTRHRLAATTVLENTAQSYAWRWTPLYDGLMPGNLLVELARMDVHAVGGELDPGALESLVYDAQENADDLSRWGQDTGNTIGGVVSGIADLLGAAWRVAIIAGIVWLAAKASE